MLLSFLLLAASAGEPSTPDPADAVVIVQQAASFCAGTHLGEGRVLTAQHCVVGLGPVRVETRDGTVLRATRTRWDRASDLAWLQIEGELPPDLPAAALASEAPAPTDPLEVVGHPYGSPLPWGYFEGTLRWSRRSGTVAARGPVALQVSMPLHPGDSGGPVFDEAGALAGVVSRRVATGPGFATRVEAARALDEDTTQRHRPLSGAWTAEFVWQQPFDGFGVSYLGLRSDLALWQRLLWRVEGAVALDDGGTGQPVGQLTTRAGWRQPVGHGPWIPWLEASAGYRAGLYQNASPLHGVVAGGAVRWGPLVVEADAVIAPGVGTVPWLGFGLAWPGGLARF